jgi:heme exporter protein B
MRSVRVFVALLRWDVLRELRRKDALANMLLFALLVLFIAQVGIGSDPARVATVGPVIFWIAIIFAGTVGLSQTFAAEREGNVLGGILSAPVDLGVFYLAKVLSTSVYVLVMEIFTLGLYAVLFNVSVGPRLGGLLLVMALFTVAYLSVGVVLAAMTSTLRGGGEVLLRILLFPLMIPMIWITLRVSETVFGAVIAGGALGPPLGLGSYVALGSAFDALYLTAGFVLFPKVLEE